MHAVDLVDTLIMDIYVITICQLHLPSTMMVDEMFLNWMRALHYRVQYIKIKIFSLQISLTLVETTCRLTHPSNITFTSPKYYVHYCVNIHSIRYCYGYTFTVALAVMHAYLSMLSRLTHP